eukprot:TRINITY_DN4497_c0_g2_i1.p2 TRINITY_DN4497_c0_g2~~TRINITY_DN4497_c0_g2_i1.p2  ORF type:complete len:130 (+),score=3.18 TRINITY_DN4497_c0_g2_i1:242-631(+)
MSTSQRSETAYDWQGHHAGGHIRHGMIVPDQSLSKHLALQGEAVAMTRRAAGTFEASASQPGIGLLWVAKWLSNEGRHPARFSIDCIVNGQPARLVDSIFRSWCCCIDTAFSCTLPLYRWRFLIGLQAF